MTSMQQSGECVHEYVVCSGVALVSGAVLLRYANSYCVVNK